MWIIIRALIALGAALYKLLFRQTPKSYPLLHSGMPYEVKEKTSKNRGVVKRYVEAPLESAFVCCLSKETTLDRWLKVAGFGGELQTGDAEFDERIYVIADHPLAQEYLVQSDDLRDVIKELIPGKVWSISITGLSIRFELPPEVDIEEMLDTIAAIRESVLAVQPSVRSRFADPFYTKALVAESFVWGVAGYAAAGYFGLEWNGQQTHLYPMDLLPYSVVAGAGIALIWMALLKLLLGESSRTPKIVAESGLMLAIAICVSAPLVISDLNTANDRSGGWAVVRDVRNKKHVSRRKGRDTYRIYLAPDAGDAKLPFALPGSIEIDSSLYRSLSIGAPVLMEIGEGTLGYP